MSISSVFVVYAIITMGLGAVLFLAGLVGLGLGVFLASDHQRETSDQERLRWLERIVPKLILVGGVLIFVSVPGCFLAYVLK